MPPAPATAELPLNDPEKRFDVGCEPFVPGCPAAAETLRRLKTTSEESETKREMLDSPGFAAAAPTSSTSATMNVPGIVGETPEIWSAYPGLSGPTRGFS